MVTMSFECVRPRCRTSAQQRGRRVVCGRHLWVVVLLAALMVDTCIADVQYLAGGLVPKCLPTPMCMYDAGCAVSNSTVTVPGQMQRPCLHASSIQHRRAITLSPSSSRPPQLHLSSEPEQHRGQYSHHGAIPTATTWATTQHLVDVVSEAVTKGNTNTAGVHYLAGGSSSNCLPTSSCASDPCAAAKAHRHKMPRRRQQHRRLHGSPAQHRRAMSHLLLSDTSTQECPFHRPQLHRSRRSAADSSAGSGVLIAPTFVTGGADMRCVPVTVVASKTNTTTENVLYLAGGLTPNCLQLQRARVTPETLLPCTGTCSNTIDTSAVRHIYTACTDRHTSHDHQRITAEHNGYATSPATSVYHLGATL